MFGVFFLPTAAVGWLVSRASLSLASETSCIVQLLDGSGTHVPGTWGSGNMVIDESWVINCIIGSVFKQPNFLESHMAVGHGTWSTDFTLVA